MVLRMDRGLSAMLQGVATGNQSVGEQEILDLMALLPVTPSSAQPYSWAVRNTPRKLNIMEK
jgi:hypothetical protein